MPAYTRVHFSLAFFLFTMIWAACSYIVFSDYTLRMLNHSEEIVTTTPWSLADWAIKGGGAEFSLCDNGICINAVSDEWTAIRRFVAIDATQLESADYFLSAVTASAIPPIVSKSPPVKPSFINVAALNGDGKLMNVPLRHVYLDRISNRTTTRGVAHVHPLTEKLRLTIAVRSKGNWHVESLTVHAVTFSSFYKWLRWIVFAGWVISVLWLLQRMFSHVPPAARWLSAGVVCAATSVGVSGIGPQVMLVLHGFLDTFQIGSDFPAEFKWNGSIHCIAHLVVTWFCYRYAAVLMLDTKRIVLLNVAIAISVEGVQLGIPERSADLYDIGLAMIGMAIGIVVFLSMRVVRARNPC